MEPKPERYAPNVVERLYTQEVARNVATSVVGPNAVNSTTI